MNRFNPGRIFNDGDKLLTILIIISTYLACSVNAESNAKVDKVSMNGNIKLCKLYQND